MFKKFAQIFTLGEPSPSPASSPNTKPQLPAQQQQLGNKSSNSPSSSSAVSSLSAVQQQQLQQQQQKAKKLKTKSHKPVRNTFVDRRKNKEQNQFLLPSLLSSNKSSLNKNVIPDVESEYCTSIIIIYFYLFILIVIINDILFYLLLLFRY